MLPMNLRKWHRHLACSGLTGWKLVPFCSRRPGSWRPTHVLFWEVFALHEPGGARLPRALILSLGEQGSTESRPTVLSPDKTRTAYHETTRIPQILSGGDERGRLDLRP